MRSAIGLMVAGLALATQSIAAPLAHPEADAQALDLAKKALALRSVRGPGNQTPDVAVLFKAALVAGGFKEADITITPMADTAYLIARWPGSDASLNPLVISGHMDVVEAKASDWQRDPFTPVVENGYLFARGATDMKLDGVLGIEALLELKRQGYQPKRDIIIEFSGDEETTMATSAIIAEKLKNAELVLNLDSGGGTLDEANGKPAYLSWSGAEKTYADFELTVTNPGGHSSEPRPVNAINQLAGALGRIANYRFKPEVSELTRASLSQMANYSDPKIAAALRAFVADPTNKKAIETLRANPATIGKIGTTCVVTMMNGGHALNALPQKATANINCRIFPGHKPSEIMAELEKAASDPAVHFKDATEGSVATDASPIRADVVAAVKRALDQIYPGVPVIPAMDSGASDSMWFRHNGVPSYGVSAIFMKPSDNFSHGLNERTPINNISPAITYYMSLFKDLSV